MADFSIREKHRGFSGGRAPPLVDFVLGAGERPAGQAETLSPTGLFGSALASMQDTVLRGFLPLKYFSAKAGLSSRGFADKGLAVSWLP